MHWINKTWSSSAREVSPGSLWHCRFAGCMPSVDVQVHTGAVVVLRVKHLLLQVTQQSQTPNPPHCPFKFRLLWTGKKPKRRFIQKLTLTFLSHYSHTHTQTAQTHQAKGHHKNSNSSSLFCKCSAMLHLSVFAEYSSHKFRHKSCFSPLLSWLSCVAGLSLGRNVVISVGENVNLSWRAVESCWGVLSDAYLLSSEFTVLFIRFLNIYTRFPFQ